MENLNKDYENMTDSELVQAVLTRFSLTQAQLAAMLFMTQPRISKALRGVCHLRRVIRTQLVEMLKVQDLR